MAQQTQEQQNPYYWLSLDEGEDTLFVHERSGHIAGSVTRIESKWCAHVWLAEEYRPRPIGEFDSPNGAQAAVERHVLPAPVQFRWEECSEYAWACIEESTQQHVGSVRECKYESWMCSKLLSGEATPFRLSVCSPHETRL